MTRYYINIDRIVDVGEHTIREPVRTVCFNSELTVDEIEDLVKASLADGEEIVQAGRML